MNPQALVIASIFLVLAAVAFFGSGAHKYPFDESAACAFELSKGFGSDAEKPFPRECSEPHSFNSGWGIVLAVIFLLIAIKLLYAGSKE